MEEEKWLLEKMLEHISENKRNLFDKIIEYRTRHITVVLENIYQPHNASAVIRSCDCFGVQDLHVIENTNKYELSKDVDMGSSKWVNVVRHNRTEDNTIECLQSLKQKGYRVIGTTPHKNDCLISELPVDQPTALVFGTELTGMSETALQACDGFVKLPMYGFTESYNISVSVALSLYELTERMRKLNLNWQLSEAEKIATKLQWVRKVIKHSAKVEREILSRRTS
jgi:tRNA (guanosine-2'-O-)-methyltransferase